jgi:dihydrofolate synthase/folylpolyglutamate synthase
MIAVHLPLVIVTASIAFARYHTSVDPRRVAVAEKMIEWLYNLQHFGIKLGLDNIRTLLEILEQPQRQFRTIHVAGTNGKGSVSAMLDSMIAAMGRRSGLFTSPHLVRPNERIRIAGVDISDDELDRQLLAMRERIESAVADGRLEAHPSFFEVMTATALETFSKHQLDAAVLEVGLGGRLDATNAVDAEVGVIVTIGLDHLKSLGSTIEQIAAEKAGIIKEGMPLISSVLQPSAIEVIQRRCDEVGADFIAAAEEFDLIEHEDDSFDLIAADRRYRNLRCALAGPHQRQNARVAVRALEAWCGINDLPTEGEVRAGLANVRWAGRLQKIERQGRANLLVDGAHNPEGIDSVASYLESHPPEEGAVLLFGATSGKSIERLLKPLAPFFETIVIGRPPIERGVDAEEVAIIARKLFKVVEAQQETPAAFSLAEAIAGNDGTIFVTGSLYLVGEVMGLLEPNAVPGPVAL